MDGEIRYYAEGVYRKQGYGTGAGTVEGRSVTTRKSKEMLLFYFPIFSEEKTLRKLKEI